MVCGAPSYRNADGRTSVILDFKFRKPTNRELVIIVAVVAVAVLLVLFYNEGWWKFNYLYKLSMERGGNL